jgi:hypothetical protein
MEADKAVEKHLRHLEERLLQPDMRKAAEEVAELLTEDFIEFGSSGRIFHREELIESLQSEPTMQRSLTNFTTSVLAPGVVLATYRVIRHDPAEAQPAYSLRSSIWKLIDGRWRILFHQGTLSREP